MIREFLPYRLQKELFGDRRKYGAQPWKDDPDWKAWTKVYPSAYEDTQRSGSVAKVINDAGYAVLRDVDLAGKKVLEIGPGGAYHLDFFKGTPAHYTAIDVCTDFFPKVKERCADRDIAATCIAVPPGRAQIAVGDATQDVVLSFYSTEHLSPLNEWAKEIFRVLKPGGEFVGAIPAEGGVLWGLGRWFTSRRILKSKYNLDVRKIVCWEHPNMCDDIFKTLAKFGKVEKKAWPLPLPDDTSLILKFRVKKPA